VKPLNWAGYGIRGRAVFGVWTLWLLIVAACLHCAGGGLSLMRKIFGMAAFLQNTYFDFLMQK
jgi:hypothetical protein